LLVSFGLVTGIVLEGVLTGAGDHLNGRSWYGVLWIELIDVVLLHKCDFFGEFVQPIALVRIVWVCRHVQMLDVSDPGG